MNHEVQQTNVQLSIIAAWLGICGIIRRYKVRLLEAGSRPGEKKMKSRWMLTMRSVGGVLLAFITAAIAALLSQGQPVRTVLPFVFAVFLIVLASRFGAWVALLGSIIGALVFSYMAYAPIGSFRVESDTAKTGMAWMILISVVGAYLLFPPTATTGRKR